MVKRDAVLHMCCVAPLSTMNVWIGVVGVKTSTLLDKGGE